MELDLTADKEFFMQTTARFLDGKAAPTHLRALRHDPAGFSSDYWRQGAELGWTSLLVSEEDGGGSISGGGLRDLALVAWLADVESAARAVTVPPERLVISAASRHLSIKSTRHVPAPIRARDQSVFSTP